MKYSDKLNGFWEEGYHYYLEFRDGDLTVRGYRRDVKLTAKIEYDADALERGERTVIRLSDNVLSRDAYGGMMTEIKELAWENGELKMLYNYTIMGETLYTLQKVDRGPFDHIIIRDDEFLDSLQGVWKEWRIEGSGGRDLVVSGNRLNWGIYGVQEFCAVSYTADPDRVYLVPSDLTEASFRGFNRIEVKPDMLITSEIIMDVSVPLSVFAREDMLEKIEVPAGARISPKSFTIHQNPYTPGAAPLSGMMGMGMMAQMTAQKQNENSRVLFCENCGTKFGDGVPNFCPECGEKVKK